MNTQPNVSTGRQDYNGSYPTNADATIPHNVQDGHEGVGAGPQVTSTAKELELVCGPLLNYRRMTNEGDGTVLWHGSVLIVTTPSRKMPELALRPIGAVSPDDENSTSNGPGGQKIEGVKLYEDTRKAFWRFRFQVPFQEFEAKWEYEIYHLNYPSGKEMSKSQTFAVPSVAQSMRILFHSCNGFSVGTDIDAWSGPALWNDVLRMHDQKPFHVMIGGGDQIYNDGVRVDGPLREWTTIGNPHKRRDYPFNEKMRAECDEYYYNNYIRWYGHAPFSNANGQIPQLNIWDDHDIIDGFGSYTDRFMNCHVFRGIGGVAHKYYLLFQHHVAPPKSTFTSDAPKAVEANAGTTPADPIQLSDSWVLIEEKDDPTYIIGPKPGPYVEEHSRSMYCQLGARIAFCGIDARTERTRHQINYPETYDLIFNRLSKELQANSDIKHLILLLGVPIAYPRLQWLENIFSSPIMGPIKFLNKRFGFAGSLFNQFDGNVDLLDDLDDHYTAHQHKHERRDLVHRLQNLCKQHSVRVTILGGDVHLAAIGRFYSHPKLGISAERDYRYMPNVISSAITNKPPPQAVADLLARRNKIHHLDHDTDETLLEMFDRDPEYSDEKLRAAAANGVDNVKRNGKMKQKTRAKNHATMPSRNYAIICESSPHGATRSSMGAPPATSGDGSVSTPPTVKSNTRKPIHEGENNAGTGHPAASGLRETGLCGPYGLDVTLRVEINPSDKEGHTDGYGFSVPALDARGFSQQGVTW
ncbi:hypothetical protein GQ43DRAFT_132697 [Delitschia confertaspora ATCC 74209]|uniref:PhoD-like phosphatase domain-containing protein n=1 Tax=Delitschia confertaspora ATCC 74209 TaxID=1513339 RepID=A0A9P4MQL6_9PLEO|nr:hypothetical protein GQ43DRAFT_132697 [Delitschia confertaspora ATCC 74209]